MVERSKVQSGMAHAEGKQRPRRPAAIPSSHGLGRQASPSAGSAEGRQGSEAKPSVPAVDRAVRVLALLESSPQRCFSLTDIATSLRIPKSTALNICSTLVAAQFIRRAQDGYQLGRRLVQLGSAYVSSVDLVREFYDACRVAPTELHALIQLSVLDEELNAVFLARQNCNSGLRLGLRAEIGRRVPANCTASGKALLAALPEYELEHRLAGVRSLPTLTPYSISSPQALRRELERIRAQGLSTDDQEVLPGVACIAATALTSYRQDGVLAVSITASKEVGANQDALARDVLARIVEALEAQL